MTNMLSIKHDESRKESSDFDLLVGYYCLDDTDVNLLILLWLLMKEIIIIEKR